MFRLKSIRNVVSALCALVVVSIGLTASAATASTKKSTILFGSIGTSTLLSAENGEDAVVALPAWVKYTNAHGGLNGHPVKVVYGSSGDNPATAISIATTMVHSDHIVACFGCGGFASLTPLANYLKSQGIPIISGGPLPDYSVSSAIFDPITSAQSEYADEALLFKKVAPKNTKVGIIYCNGPAAGTACLQESQAFKGAAQSAGLDVVYDGSAPLSAPNYTAQVLAAKEAGAQEINAIEDPAGTLTLLENAAQQGWNPYTMGSEPQYTTGFNPGSAYPSQAKLLIPVTTPPWSLSTLLKPYVGAVTQYSPGNVVLGEEGATVWVEGQLLQEISKNFGATVTAADITKDLLALKGATVGGLTPPLTFPKGSNRASVNTCTNVVQFKSGSWIAPLGSNTFVCSGKK